MAKTNDVDVALYSDDEWLALDVAARWVYVWAFTNPRCNMAGLYKVSLRVASVETGWTPDEVASAFAELETARFVAYDPEGRWLWVRTRAKHIRGQSKTIAKSIISALRDLPRGHPFGPAFYAEYTADDSWGSGKDRGALVELLEQETINRDDWLDDPSDAPSMPHPGGTGDPFMGSGAGAGGEGKNGSNAPSRTRARATRKPVDPDALPADFPEQLVPLLDDVVIPALRRVAEAKGALVVTRAAAARAVAAYPRKPHERVAPEFEHYWVHGDGQSVERTDIVATYRRRLEQIADRAGPIGVVPSTASAADWVAQFNSTAPGRAGA